MADAEKIRQQIMDSIDEESDKRIKEHARMMQVASEQGCPSGSTTTEYMIFLDTALEIIINEIAEIKARLG